MTDFPEALRNRINLEQVPFSDRGSRILVFKGRGGSDPGLYVELAERLTTLQPGLDTYRTRPPFIQDLRFVDAEGNPLPYQLTTYPHRLDFETPAGRFSLAFQDTDTLSIRLPPESVSGIRFAIAPAPWQNDHQGGVFEGVLNMAYTTNGHVVENRILEAPERCLVDFRVRSGDDTAITINIRPDQALRREVPSPAGVVEAAERRWRQWFAQAPPVAGPWRAQYLYAWWIMANNLLSPRGFLTREAMAPSKTHYVGVWLWDACFHALAYRHTDIELAREQLCVLLDHQLPDGMIPDAIHDEGVVTHLDLPVAAPVTKPPVIAWAAMKLHETSPSREFLDEIYEPLVRWNAWWFDCNDDDADGIVQYSHPYSSGLDDNPLWDGGMPVESPDINTYLVVQMESLAQMAHILGKTRDAARWERRRRALACRMVEHFFDPEAGVFWATHDHRPIRVLTPFNLYPMWTGLLEDDIVRPLLAHLTDPSGFWTTHPLPTVARSDPLYDGQQMWRGPAWININYLFVEALQRVGRAGLAAALRQHTLDMVMAHDGIYEYYTPVPGAPPPAAASTFGWSAALFIDLAIQASQTAVPATPAAPDVHRRDTGRSAEAVEREGD